MLNFASCEYASVSYKILCSGRRGGGLGKLTKVFETDGMRTMRVCRHTPMNYFEKEAALEIGLEAS